MDEAQSPLFLIYMEEYLRGVQSTLTEWIARGLQQVCHCSACCNMAPRMMRSCMLQCSAQS